MYDVVIIGCGIVGASAAFELSKYRISVAVIERGNDVASGATKANSAIIHAGYDPEPETLMARLNTKGNAMVGELCRLLDVPYRRCGSLVLAFSREERDILEALLARGEKNGVPDLELLDKNRLREMEPHASDKAVAALYAPSAGIVSPWELTLALMETAVKNGAELFLENEVTGIHAVEGGYRVETNAGTLQARCILNAAGGHADTVHNMVSKPAFRVIPDRGEYYLLDKNEGNRVSHVVFQCPTKIGKGTLVAPTVHGNLIVGPNNEAPDCPDDVATTVSGLSQVARMARKSIPSIDLRASIRNFAGVRAAADTDDFIIAEAEDAPGFIDIAGIKSPGLTSAPAIAEMAAELLRESGLTLEKKERFFIERKRIRFAELTPEEKADLVKRNPAYGQVVCRCETVTEGEILDARRS
ncbi:MAG: NAD(P)/FAD-dependent oxidoreductase, partial [Clostridiales bacterium]|nr:NAD(P)/FAD-dependent oxidoreductase [Clostridiales bacterium]